MAEQDPDFLRSQAQIRLSILQGIIRSLDLGWPLVEAVEACSDKAAARSLLLKPPFEFDEVQAEHILDRTLSQRTKLGREQLESEIADLQRLLRGNP